MADKDRSFATNAASPDRPRTQAPGPASPEEDWGEATAEGAVYSSNHSRRDVRAEAERSQGRKTRQANKDIVSRRT